MSWSSARAAVARTTAAATAATAAMVAIASAGSARAEAQMVREGGIQALVAAQDPLLASGGLYGALRTTRRTRFAITAGTGGSGGEFVARGEVLGHFLLNPSATGKPGLYAGGGMALVAGPAERGYAVLLLGIEGSPGGRSGWAMEAGLGGGFRITAGYRWRSFQRKVRPG